MLPHHPYTIFLLKIVRRWKTILGVGVLFALAAWLVNFALPNTYTSAMLVAPKSSSMLGSIGSMGLGSTSGSLGSLAKLTGQSADDSLFDRYQALFYSQSLANSLLADRATVAVLFGLTWDRDEKKWKQPSGLGSSVKQMLRWIVGANAWHPPQTSDLVKFLQKNLSVQKDRSTDFVSLSFTSKDPQFSLKFLNEVHHIADGLLRQQVLVSSQRRVDFLTDQLKQTSVGEYRQTLTSLILSEAKTLMVAHADESFAVDVIDRPTVPTQPSGPKRLMNILAGFLLGVLLAGTYAVFVDSEELRLFLRSLFRRY